MSIRNGPGDFKTKIGLGTKDLILYKKVPSDASWKIVDIKEDLPDVNFGPPKPQTNSPPIGRSRISKRKERSPLNDSAENRSKSKRSTSPEAHESLPKSHKPDDHEKTVEKDSLN